ncbi:MAG: response regulator transcription factor [Acidimicrobiales bacterium]
MVGDAGTIVVIEDDINIADLLDMYLRQEGFRVLQAADAVTGLDLVDREHPRLVVMDIGLPGQMDGLSACRQLRQKNDVPIIMLTARDGEIDRVLGLELGADDYMTKPFSPRELVARVRAVLRRSEGPGREEPEHYVLAEVDLDLKRREVRRHDQIVALTTREFNLLAFLVRNAGLVLTRRQLLDGVWGQDWYGDDRTVDVHVRQLRKKLGDSIGLATIWGVGYRLG